MQIIFSKGWTAFFVAINEVNISRAVVDMVLELKFRPCDIAELEFEGDFGFWSEVAKQKRLANAP